MFIRESKTTNKKTGKVYVKHTLVESIRTEKGPRQRIIMTLGKLKLDRSLWKDLANGLDFYLNGNHKLEELSLFDLDENLLNELTQLRAVISHKKEREHNQKNLEPTPTKVIEQVNINSLTVTESRSLGPELVVYNTWKQLEFDKILIDCGFNKRELALAASVIWGRMIVPGSDLKTWRWVRESSSISDFFEADINKVHKDRIYEITDKLLEHKDVLEERLYKRQCEIFKTENTLFLFDLTNFYFEGKGEGNELAKRGKSKEKRSQNVLVSLALIVDQYGVPVKSKVYSGNVGEPQTLKEILEECGLIGSEHDFLTKPTLAMDRGIATKENIDFIKSHKFPYTVIERANTTKEFSSHFESNEGFKVITDAKGQKIHLKKVDNKVLCRSESRSEKETAMISKKVGRIIADLDKLEKSIAKGSIKDEVKIQQRIGKIRERHKGFDKLFEVHFDVDSHTISYSKKNQGTKLEGCYIIEHSQIEGDAEEIWRIYTTLTKVEAAFRSMKTDLGTRPVYHQGAERTQAHLFLSILAYHMLVNIERRLQETGCHQQWSTIRTQLDTHTRNVIQWENEKEEVQFKKISSTPEPVHFNIYQRLKIKNPLKDFRY